MVHGWNVKNHREGVRFGLPYRIRTNESFPEPFPTLVAGIGRARESTKNPQHRGADHLIGKSMAGVWDPELALAESVAAVVCLYPLVGRMASSELRDKKNRVLR